MTTEEIHQLLYTIGLTDKECLVYMALLQNGEEVTTIEVTEHTALPRTTVYDILVSLAEKGIIQQTKKGSTKAFHIDTPHFLYAYLAKQEADLKRAKQNLKQILPELEALRNPALPVPSLRVYQGESGLLSMWEEQLISAGPEETLNIMCNSGFFSTFNQRLQELSKRINHDKKSIKVLVQTREEDPIFIKIRNFEVKATQEKYIFAAGIDVIGSFIGFWNEMDTLTGMLLENEQVANVQRCLFDKVWYSIS